MILKIFTFLYKMITTYIGIQIINEYIKWLHGMEYIKSILNGLTETI